jgi:hypothetical protein
MVYCPGGGPSCADPHDVNNTYTWSTNTSLQTGPWNFDGTAATSFLVALNTPPGFAGHTDWRLPTTAGGALLALTGLAPELESISTPTPICTATPCDYPLFGPIGWLVPYWTSVSASNPNSAYTVRWDDSYVGGDAKANSRPVRAVRGGP